MKSLKALGPLGQSVWLDFLSREFLDQGGLERLIEEDGLAGVTSNPSIFEKAIGESSQYDADIEKGLAAGTSSVGTAYEQLAVADICRAADALRPVYQATEGRDGFVSLEVSPYLAMDTGGTVAEALRLWQAVERPNLMIKVPGTAPGLPAIRRLLGDGLNVNITLLFAQKVYEDVVEAYLSALERRVAQGLPIDRVASVASFFVSRIDTVADAALDKVVSRTKDAGARAALERLHGKIAVANAKLAYQIYLRSFSGQRWDKLARLGAQPQRLLWASTGTKNPAYRDVLYVEDLIGPDTVNTMPLKTMDAFRDHGTARATLAQGVDDAREALASLERAGISLDRITSDLVVDGVRQFADSFDKLLGAVADKRRRMLGGKLNSAAFSLAPALQADVDRIEETWRTGGHVRRLWSKDATLWSGHDEDRWLGWLEVVDQDAGTIAQLLEFQMEIGSQGLSDVLLLGMGGSSLGPEVIGQTLGSVEGFPRLHVLDSTDPAQVRCVESKVDLQRTLFIVSSKSGSTLEPSIFMDHFLARAIEVVGENRAGKRFVAITDPNSRLQKTAEEKGFRQIFHGWPSIGGRYSVLSKFGMVPLAATGHDVRGFLETAAAMARACGPDVPPAHNPGVALGLVMGALARRGRDKVTIIASPSLADFGAWAEQLIAESTGKDGKGLIPVDAEPLAEPSAYGSDRLFIHLRDLSRPDAVQDAAVEAIERTGHPMVRIELAGPSMISQEFFRWEIATAVAGAVLGINPFDQPDVEASKIATQELTQAYEKSGALPAETPVFKENGIALFADERNASALKQAGAGNTLESWLRAHFGRIHAGDYVALLAFVERSEAHIGALEDLRRVILGRKHVATCLGFGPRYLHSTGQAYKGGPDSGVFLQITADDGVDLAIPGRHSSFAVVKAAQARGDFAVLAERKRRLLRAHFDHGVDAGLVALGEAVRRALS